MPLRIHIWICILIICYEVMQFNRYIYIYNMIYIYIYIYIYICIQMSAFQFFQRNSITMMLEEPCVFDSRLGAKSGPHGHV